MAQTISPGLPDRPSPMTKFLSRLRGSSSKSNSKSSSKSDTNPSSQQTSPIPTLPALLPSPLPLVLPAHQSALSNLGWTTITFPPPPSPSTTSNSLPPPGPHPLQSASDALFHASQLFFAQSTAEKAQWAHRLGSEEGWSAIPGEKEFITLRTLAYCPEVLRGPAKRYWDLMGAQLERTLGQVESTLGMAEAHSDEDGEGGRKSGLTRFVGPCARMQEREEEKTATMLRLFRYEGWEEKVVAEPHADLGLLSVVVGDTPGLETWDGVQWFPVEKEVERSGLKGASLLVGRQLERFTNGRYPAGGHRVVAYGDGAFGGRQDKEGAEKYRFSIVFVLRAHESVVIESDDLETEVTGRWKEPVHGVTAGELYAKLRSSHFNINAAVEERRKQRQDLVKAGEKGASG
ncbi:hypothetical protein E8E13_003178 [Curvularia kusanoi]|uniref:Clavaminate synthase-like protein n=1 Tax=Curvularia kusanoi TaxID=90978 RepID=A0A9P4T7F0_CURKU|nr:hypothetical protein E8E13_003178 [Curvularia kusanoi]